MGPRPPGWPPDWDWFDLTELLERNSRTSDTDQAPLPAQALAHMLSLQQEPAQFIGSYLHKDEFGQRPAGYKDVLFGFDDVELTGWGASCGPALAPARYAIAISTATFLQQYLALDRLLTVSTFLSNSEDGSKSEVSHLQFLLVIDGEIRGLFKGESKSPSLLGVAHGRYSLMRQMLVYCPFFLFLHELSHIADGHLEYRAKQAELRKSLPIREIWKFRAIDSRCMEFLADSSAVLRGTEMVAAALADNPRQAAIYHMKQFGAAVALNMLLINVFEQYRSSRPTILEKMGFKSYPSPALRLAWCMLLFSGGSFDNMWPDQLAGEVPSRAAKNAVLAGMEQMIGAWDALGWARSSAEVDDLAIGPWMSEVAASLVVPDGFEWPNSLRDARSSQPVRT